MSLRRTVRRALVVSAAVATTVLQTSGLQAAPVTWDRGAGTNSWTDAANWNPDGVPLAADTPTFTDTGAGTIDLNAAILPSANAYLGLAFNNATTGYTLQNGTLKFGTLTQSSGASVINTLSTVLNSTGAINVNSGTLVLSNGNNVIAGPVAIAAGAKLDVMAPTSASIGAITLNGGTLVVRGGVTTTTDALFDRINLRTTGNADLASFNTTVNTVVPNATRDVTFAMTYDNARATVAGNDNQNGNDGPYSTNTLKSYNNNSQNNIETITTGKFSVAAQTTFTFGTRSDDGSVIYIDSNKNGAFESNEIVVNNNFDQGYTNRTGNITLAAGTYNIGIGWYQGGCCDNNGLEVRYGLTGNLGYNDANMVVLNPASPLAGTSFFYDVFTPASLTGSNLTVTAPSVLDIQSTTGAVGNVSFNSGTSLTVQGQGGAVATLAALSGTGTATLDTSIDTTAGALSGFTTLTKAGANTLTLGTDSPTFAGNIVISAGTLKAASAQALGIAPGIVTVQSGGQLSLAADGILKPVTLFGTGTAGNGALETNTNDRSFGGPITLGADSFIVSSTGGKTLTLTGGINTATFQSRFGGNGDIVVNTVGISGSGGIRKTEGGALTIGVASSYSGVTQIENGTFNINAALSGTSGINLTGGTINGNNAVKATAPINVTGGVYNVNNAASLTNTNTVSGGGVIRVLNTTAAAGTIAVNSGRLQFDAGVGNTATLTATSLSVDNNGVVHARSGIADLSTVNIAVTAASIQNGLIETQLGGAFNEGGYTQSTTIVTGPNKAQTTSNAAFPDNTTFAYAGKILVPNNNGNGTGTIAFGENFDDNVLLKIDGAQVLRDQTWNNVTAATITLSAGYHDIDLRFGQGGGGVGPVADGTNHWGPGTGNNGLGFGIYYPTGSPIDPGKDGNNFVNPDPTSSGSVLPANLFGYQVGGGSIQVDAGAELRARTVANATTINLAGTLTLSAGALGSNVTTLVPSGPVATANVLAGHTLAATNLTISPGGLSPTNLIKTGAGTLSVSAASTITLNNNSVIASGGLLDLSNTKFVGTAPTVQAGLQAQLYVNTLIDPRNNAGNVATLLALTPTNVKLLNTSNGPNGGLDFRNDNDLATFFGNTAVGTDTGNQNWTAAFVGQYTAQVTGTHTFSIGQNDDNTAIFLDKNQNGVFESTEQVIQRGCCNNNTTDSTPGTIDLTAGQKYNLAIINEDTGGGGSIAAKFIDGGAVSGITVIAPGATGQENTFSYATGGATLQVDSGAILSIAGTSGPIVANLAGTLRYASQGSAATSQLATVNVLAAGATIETQNNQTVSITSALTLTGNLTKTGVGRLAINVVGTGSGSVTVTGGTLGGSGSVAGPVAVQAGGTLNAGNSVGTFGTGNLTITGGTLTSELDPTATGQKSDVVNVTGTVNVSGGNLSVVLLSAPTIGQSFLIVNNDSTDAVSGTFTQGSFVDTSFNSTPYRFSINYNSALAGGTGNDIVLTNIAVPEPASVGLLGVAAVGLLARRRRR